MKKEIYSVQDYLNILLIISEAILNHQNLAHKNSINFGKTLMKDKNMEYNGINQGLNRILNYL